MSGQTVEILKKNLTELNKLLRKEYVLSGVSKMKKDEVIKHFNDRFIESHTKNYRKYFIPKDKYKTGNYDAKKHFQNVMDTAMKKYFDKRGPKKQKEEPKKEVKKEEPKKVVKKEEPKKKPKFMILREEIDDLLKQTVNKYIKNKPNIEKMTSVKYKNSRKRQNSKFLDDAKSIYNSLGFNFDMYNIKKVDKMFNEKIPEEQPKKVVKKLSKLKPKKK